MDNNDVMITGADRIEQARWLTVRGALRLEIRGLTRHGRPARVLANEITGQNHKTSRAAYTALNAHIVDALGAQFDKPL